MYNQWRGSEGKKNAFAELDDLRYQMMKRYLQSREAQKVEIKSEVRIRK